MKIKLCPRYKLRTHVVGCIRITCAEKKIIYYQHVYDCDDCIAFVQFNCIDAIIGFLSMCHNGKQRRKKKTRKMFYIRIDSISKSVSCLFYSNVQHFYFTFDAYHLDVWVSMMRRSCISHTWILKITWIFRIHFQISWLCYKNWLPKRYMENEWQICNRSATNRNESNRIETQSSSIERYIFNFNRFIKSNRIEKRNAAKTWLEAVELNVFSIR